jgi:hypothetical protein
VKFGWFFGLWTRPAPEAGGHRDTDERERDARIDRIATKQSDIEERVRLLENQAKLRNRGYRRD